MGYSWEWPGLDETVEQAISDMGRLESGLPDDAAAQARALRHELQEGPFAWASDSGGDRGHVSRRLHMFKVDVRAFAAALEASGDTARAAGYEEIADRLGECAFDGFLADEY